ncbi:hypothetical protein LTR86_011092 [Recurvomyces mirabilis]|nr:hypothetical protein LTR86_011092 [Recurvomyces mirabilis]
MFGSSYSSSGQTNHICGCYYQAQQSLFATSARHYLPQVKLDSHTTITPLYFTTKLTQTFRNSGSDVLKQVRYTFPLYDGVAVSGYTISYADKVLKGIVKQKDDAKQTYDNAISRGETAGLLESLPTGIFGVTLGNVPSISDIVVKITYCGELKHDAAIDGLRYTLPTAIAPRYGQYPGELMQMNAQATSGISITVDVDMVGSAIRKVQSPSHPIAISMGATSTAPGKSDSQPHRASATLTLGTTILADDFVLQLLIDDIEKPRALVEHHPTLSGHRAIMTTLVPKFVLESTNPEIVFIADQSGSMGGTKNTALVKALTVFLKSLPFGVRFNVCAFGSHHDYLWPKSQAYNENNVKSALSFVGGFNAGYGGTELLKPIVAAFEQRLGDMPLEVMVLTDGQIWGEDSVFDFINKQILKENVDARVFALGIGNGASTTLVNGMARAGKGFAQFVTESETDKTDQKVMRMLKGALYAHTWGYKLDVEFVGGEAGRDAASSIGTEELDFEMVDQPEEHLAINVKEGETQPGTSTATTPSTTLSTARPKRSFFDASIDPDKTSATTDRASRYAHLPHLDAPKLIQAPVDIPPLFPFNRTTAYILIDQSEKRSVKAVTLRAESASGPLELSMPVKSIETHGVPSMHQLAVRKAIQDLEEGRGSWIQPLKEQHTSRFDELVEREAVRLGVQYQVAGKWTSFVAVNQKTNQTAEQKKSTTAAKPRVTQAAALAPPMINVGSATMEQYEREMADAACMPLADEESDEEDEAVSIARHGTMSMSMAGMSAPGVDRISALATPAPSSRGVPRTNAPSPGGLFGGATQAFGAMSGGLFGSAAKPASASTGGGLFGSATQSASSAGGNPFGNPSQSHAPSFGSGLFSTSAIPPSSAGSLLFGASMQVPAQAGLSPVGFPPPPMAPGQSSQQAADLAPKRRGFGFGQSSFHAPAATISAPLSLHDLINLQKFSGAWMYTNELLKSMGGQEHGFDGWKNGHLRSKDVKITLMVLAFLESINISLQVASNQKSSALLNLPPELRNIIYQHVFEITAADGPVNIFATSPPEAVILQSCRKIYNEANSLHQQICQQYWSETNFVVRPSVEGQNDNSLRDEDLARVANIGLLCSANSIYTSDRTPDSIGLFELLLVFRVPMDTLLAFKRDDYGRWLAVDNVWPTGQAPRSLGTVKARGGSKIYFDVIDDDDAPLRRCLTLQELVAVRAIAYGPCKR